MVLALAVGPGPRDAKGIKVARAEVDAKLAYLQEFIRGSNGTAVLALDADDIGTARRDGKVAVIAAFQNARSLGRCRSLMSSSIAIMIRAMCFFGFSSGA